MRCWVEGSGPDSSRGNTQSLPGLLLLVSYPHPADSRLSPESSGVKQGIGIGFTLLKSLLFLGGLR